MGARRRPLRGPALAQQGTFRARTELAAVDVTVGDANGNPIAGLTANDFSDLIKGKPRAIQSLQFIKTQSKSNRSSNSADVSSNESAASGRALIFVIDEDNLRPATLWP